MDQFDKNKGEVMFNFLSYLPLVLRFIPSIVKIIENLVSEPKQGVAKKQAVTEIVFEILDTIHIKPGMTTLDLIDRKIEESVKKLK